MRDHSRRSFLGLAAAVPALAATETTRMRGGSERLAHPLDGIRRENITIRDIKVTPMSYELPRDKQWLTGTFITWKTDAVLVQVFTDQGIVGIGESSPYGGPADIKEFIETFVRPVIVGKNPFDVEYLACAWAGGRPNYAAWAGVDAALWDVIGKAKNVPVYKLLAIDREPNPHIRMYASGGVEYAWYKQPEDLIDEAVRHKFDFKPWIDRDAYDIVQPDCNVAGITEAWHIAHIANLRKKYCCPHNWHGGLTTMANAALVAAIPNRLVLELNQTYNPLKEALFKEPLVVKNGYMDLPNKPGFGVDLSDDVARKFPFLPGTYSRPNADLPS